MKDIGPAQVTVQALGAASYRLVAVRRELLSTRQIREAVVAASFLTSQPGGGVQLSLIATRVDDLIVNGLIEITFADHVCSIAPSVGIVRPDGERIIWEPDPEQVDDLANLQEALERSVSALGGQLLLPEVMDATD